MSCTYRFVNTTLCNHGEYEIILRQQPDRAKIYISNDRDKRTIEPPPILQLQWLNTTDQEKKQYLQNPFYFMIVNISLATDDTLLPSNEYLTGATVSSLYKLKDIDNTDGGFFTFGNLGVKIPGSYKLHFSLFEILNDQDSFKNVKTIVSNHFQAYPSKSYPGPIEPTFLSRTFANQGVKIRIKKHHPHSIAANTKKIKRKQISESYNIKKEILSPPAYALDNDVHFGRWQSKKQKSITTPSISPTMSSPTLSQSSITSNLPPLSNNNTIYRLPPLSEVIKNTHSTVSLSNNELYHFPIDTSFFK